MTGAPRTGLGPLAVTLATRAAYEAGDALTAGRCRRPNYRGASASMAAGPAVAATALAAILADRNLEVRVRRAALVAGAAAAAAGALDDWYGSARVRGLRGHLDALRRGRFTTGVAKLGLIGAAGLAAGAVLAGDPPRRRTWWHGVLAGGVVAGSANLANLLDVRPGRALKAVLLAVAPLGPAAGSSGRLARLTGAAAAGVLGPDLRERAMLGDTGANCLGALAGVALVSGAPARRIAITFATLCAVTAASEVVSFSQLIDATPPLAWLDRLGRVADAREERRRS